MTGTASKPRPIASILAALFVVFAVTPRHAWAAVPTGSPAAVPSSKVVSNDSSEEAADNGSRLMVMRDFNRDGISDMAEAISSGEDHSGPDFLTISLGQADGTFKPAAFRLPLSHSPKAMVAGDFNNDGIPDLIVGGQDGALTLFLGDGSGNLVPAGEVGRVDSVVSMVVADFNHDGIPDLAISDWRASSVSVLLGVGNGTFRNGWSFSLRMPGTSPHLAVADFNGDGISDLAVVYGDDDGDTFDVMLGNGKGAFTPSPQLSLVRDPTAHCVP